MMDLDDLERAAGLDPDDPDYQLRQSLAEADDELLEELVRMRKEKGLTQQDVADRMKRHKSAVCNFERLSADPHLSTIRRYAAAIGAHITHQVKDYDLIRSSDYDVPESCPGNVVTLSGGVNFFVQSLVQSAAARTSIAYTDLEWNTDEATYCSKFAYSSRGYERRTAHGSDSEHARLVSTCTADPNG